MLLPSVFFRWFFSCAFSGSAAQPLRNFLLQAFTPSTCHRTNSSLPSPRLLTYSSFWDYESCSKDGLSGSSLPSPSLAYILHVSLECPPSHFLQSPVQIPSSPQILPISLLFFSLTWLLWCNSALHIWLPKSGIWCDSWRWPRKGTSLSVLTDCSWPPTRCHLGQQSWSGGAPGNLQVLRWKSAWMDCWNCAVGQGGLWYLLLLDMFGNFYKLTTKRKTY